MTKQLPDLKSNEYTTNFPYLEKAKSPPAAGLQDVKSRPNAGQIKYRTHKKAGQGKRQVPPSTTSPASNALGANSSCESTPSLIINDATAAKSNSSSSNPSSVQVNEDDFFEILKNKKNHSRSNTSTPTSGHKSKQKALEMKLNLQNKGLRKLGLEPSSEFVKNIMDNHSF